MIPAAPAVPDTRGRFGPYGGRYVPETLVAPLEELERAYADAQSDPKFQARAGEPAAQFCRAPHAVAICVAADGNLGGPRIYIKREDLLHTGSHKINNCLGQGLLAVRMGKKPRDRGNRRRAARRRDGDGGGAAWALNASSTWAPKTWSGSG